MPVASPAAVRKLIASGDVGPLYLLQGEDDIEKSALAHEFEELVEEGLRAFNVERVHATDVSSGDKLVAVVASLVTAARTLPMMAPRRVVIVHQARALLIPKRESEAASRALEELEALLSSPDPRTTLVLVSDPLDRRSRIYKLLARQATLVECGLLEAVDDAARWVVTRVGAAGMKMDPAGAREMAVLAGFPERPTGDGRTGDVKRLRNDVDRLVLYALGQKAVSIDDVREVVGSGALQNPWALSDAVAAGDPRGALRQLTLLRESGAAPELIMGQLAAAVRNRFPSSAPAMLRPAVQALFRTAVNLRETGSDPRVLLERLVVELCARGAGRPLQAGGARRL
jgi:DNA polymerase-3 subunit delta